MTNFLVNSDSINMRSIKKYGVIFIVIISLLVTFLLVNTNSQDKSIIVNLKNGAIYKNTPFTLQVENLAKSSKVELELTRPGLHKIILLEFIETKNNISTYTFPAVGAGNYNVIINGKNKLSFKAQYYKKEVTNYKECINPKFDEAEGISCFRQYLLSTLNKPAEVEQAIKDVLTVASIYSKGKSPDTNFRCHLYLHWVGEATILAYPKVEDALKNHFLLCGKGYLHGVISASILNRNIDLIKKDINHLCDYFETYGQIRSCTHGIGHDFYSKFGNATLAFEHCGMLTDDDFKNECAGGVSMKIGFDYLDNYPEALTKNPNLPNDICAPVPSVMRNGCYRFIFLIYNNNKDRADAYHVFAKVCAAVTGVDNQSCWAGAGVEYTTENPDLPTKSLWDFCNQAKDEAFKLCITNNIYYRLQQFNLPTASVYCKLAINMVKGREYCDFWQARQKERINNFGNVYQG